MNTARYTVTAVVTFRGDERRHLLGTAATRRQARRLAYRCGLMRVPSRFSAEMFDLEILDTETSERVTARWATDEAIRRSRGQMTVGERGIW